MGLRDMHVGDDNWSQQRKQEVQIRQTRKGPILFKVDFVVQESMSDDVWSVRSVGVWQ